MKNVLQNISDKNMPVYEYQTKNIKTEKHSAKNIWFVTSCNVTYRVSDSKIACPLGKTSGSEFALRCQMSLSLSWMDDSENLLLSQPSVDTSDKDLAKPEDRNLKTQLFKDVATSKDANSKEERRIITSRSI